MFATPGKGCASATGLVAPVSATTVTLAIPDWSRHQPYAQLCTPVETVSPSFGSCSTPKGGGAATGGVAGVPTRAPVALLGGVAEESSVLWQPVRRTAVARHNPRIRCAVELTSRSFTPSPWCVDTSFLDQPT